MVRILVLALLLLFPGAAYAYQRPTGAPTLAVPEHGVTVSVFAVQTAVGHAIGVFELLASGDWTMCRDCFTNPEFPGMEPAIVAAGGARQYLESKLPEVNSILARRFPAVIVPLSNSGVDQVNFAISQSYTLRMVNGVPTLAGK